MIERKKKLRFFQLTLLVFGILLIYLTYYSKDKNIKESSIFKSNSKKIEDQATDNDADKKELFFNIEYSGLDLHGNRYLLKSNTPLSTPPVFSVGRIWMILSLRIEIIYSDTTISCFFKVDF